MIARARAVAPSPFVLTSGNYASSRPHSRFVPASRSIAFSSHILGTTRDCTYLDVYVLRYLGALVYTISPHGDLGLAFVTASGDTHTRSDVAENSGTRHARYSDSRVWLTYTFSIGQLLLALGAHWLGFLRAQAAHLWTFWVTFSPSIRARGHLPHLAMVAPYPPPPPHQF